MAGGAAGGPAPNRRAAHAGVRRRATCVRGHIAFLLERAITVNGRVARPEYERRRVAEGTVQYLLILLVAITMACGAAASVTISLGPAYADDSGKGY